mgnify:CR=1 FL=1
MTPNQKEKLFSILKLVIIIIVFLIAIVAVSILFTSFFRQSGEKKLRYEECILLQNPQGTQVDCFGCANGHCKDAPIDWIPYQPPEIGIPYACYETEQGCQLAQ